MSQNGQAQFKNLAAFAARFLKCVWPFWEIMHQRVKAWEFPSFHPLFRLCVILNKNPSHVIHNMIDWEKEFFLLVVFICSGIDLKNIIIHKKQLCNNFRCYISIKPLTFPTIYWCDRKGHYLEYYLYFQIHRHDCLESLKEHLK